MTLSYDKLKLAIADIYAEKRLNIVKVNNPTFNDAATECIKPSNVIM
ncbi:hypothetical protein [Lysinibacillus xylanilyticus]|nr:hypothetical protein [Lysinibacillus xylanilyticus]